MHNITHTLSLNTQSHFTFTQTFSPLTQLLHNTIQVHRVLRAESTRNITSDSLNGREMAENSKNNSSRTYIEDFGCVILSAPNSNSPYEDSGDVLSQDPISCTLSASLIEPQQSVLSESRCKSAGILC
ncbi:uncharacterized protein LOC105180174 isoform X2 [Sesamum indicum]|uniref:Uncharacterized protein LOC105180174 isoform X2 n=1 Tax=Sesamum indicum TaxID=4182 RepID=A0A8M8UTW5_SESIN|nr:uncharacterized protein LOC105180174 isoform X2 [Sesamum indicum]